MIIDEELLNRREELTKRQRRPPPKSGAKKVSDVFTPIITKLLNNEHITLIMDIKEIVQSQPRDRQTFTFGGKIFKIKSPDNPRKPWRCSMGSKHDRECTVQCSIFTNQDISVYEQKAVDIKGQWEFGYFKTIPWITVRKLHGIEEAGESDDTIGEPDYGIPTGIPNEIPQTGTIADACIPDQSVLAPPASPNTAPTRAEHRSPIGFKSEFDKVAELFGHCLDSVERICKGNYPTEDIRTMANTLFMASHKAGIHKYIDSFFYAKLPPLSSYPPASNIDPTENDYTVPEDRQPY